eukprot:jgi/Mesen1/10652/ME000009S10443
MGAGMPPDNFLQRSVVKSEMCIEWKRGGVTGVRSARNGSRIAAEGDHVVLEHSQKQDVVQQNLKVIVSTKKVGIKRLDWQTQKRRSTATRRSEKLCVTEERNWTTEVLVKKPHTRSTRKRSIVQPSEPQVDVLPTFKRRKRGNPTSGLAKMAQEGLKRSRRKMEKIEQDEAPEPVRIPKLKGLALCAQLDLCTSRVY